MIPETTSADQAPQKGHPRKIVILDTNVLLADPNAVVSFPRAEVVIPETVLGELDKLKTARVDPDLRFRGREVSRLLFELSEDNSLIEGVDLPDGGRLRVATLDSDKSLPEGVSTRNADDRILATAWQVCDSASEKCEVTLVTNDLNMLLKAQTLGVSVERYGEGTEGGFAKRFIIRPFQRYKVPIGILAVALAVFAAVLVLVIFIRPGGSADVPSEFRQLLSEQQKNALEALIALQKDPNNDEALLAMAAFYYDATSAAQTAGDQAAVIQNSKSGIRYYEQYLKEQPRDNDARADMASLLFYSGQTDPAIRAVAEVLESDPEHVNANFNLGVIYLYGRRDLQAALSQMNKVIQLTQNDQNQHGALLRAQSLKQQIESEMKGTSSTETTQGVTQ